RRRSGCPLARADGGRVRGTATRRSPAESRRVVELPRPHRPRAADGERPAGAARSRHRRRRLPGRNRAAGNGAPTVRSHGLGAVQVLTRYLLLATCCSLLATCYSLLATRYLLLATRCLLLAARCSPFGRHKGQQEQVASS